MVSTFMKRLLQSGFSPAALAARVSFLRLMGTIPKASQAEHKKIRKVLFSFPYHSVGDVILSLTLLERVHELWPDAEIDVAVGALTSELIASIPYVHRTFAIPRIAIRFGPLGGYSLTHQLTGVFQREMASNNYDIAIAPRWDWADSYLSSYLAYLTGAPVRCGYSGTVGGGSSANERLLSHVAFGGTYEHESVRYVKLLMRCGLEGGPVDEELSVRPLDSLCNIARERQTQGIGLRMTFPEPYAILSPGATNPRRMWAVERFAEVGNNLWRQYGTRSVVVGGESDRILCNSLCEKIGGACVSLAGQTNILQMLDLIAGCDLFVGNDSGPAHMAGALGKPTVVLSPFPQSSDLEHPNSPRRFRPMGPVVKVVQPMHPLAPCSPICLLDEAHCILQITVADAMEAIMDAVPIESQNG